MKYSGYAGLTVVNLSTNKHHATIHRAKWIVADSRTIIQDGYLITARGRIHAVGTGRPPRQEGVLVDHGPGILMPPLVNTHTHLELSAFKGQITTDKGFTHWVREMLALREKTSPQQLIKGLEEGIEQLLKSGTIIIGEISSLGLSWDLLKVSALAGVMFIEHLGHKLPPDMALKKSGHFTQAFAGHAPHTTAPTLLAELIRANQEAKRPTSIHLAESTDEVEFLTTGQGRWADLLTQRGISFRDWPMPAKSPVAYLQTLGLLRPGLLAVHMLQCQNDDLARLAENHVSICVCPTSNLKLHGRLPDIPAMLNAGLSISLGTDSLASCDHLSIFSEMAVVAGRFPEIALDRLFQIATANGAAALGVGNAYGTLAPGKQALMLYLAVNENSKKNLFARIVNRPELTPKMIDER